LQDKLDALKREYDGQAGESAQLLKKIKTGVEKNLVSLRARVSSYLVRLRV
jgi:hypothetical protein